MKPEALPGRPVVVTGMHRSGTSLVAGLLAAAGVRMGERMIGPGRGNPRGHFEDVEMVRFHTELLLRNDPSGMALWTPGEGLEPGEDARCRARALGEIRSGRSPWGWKDPRTVLFLGLWAQLFPEGTFLFVFRDPARVIDSLRRRRDRHLMVVLLGRSLMPSRRRWGPFRYQRALDSWVAYNRRIVSFVRSFPDRSLLFEIDDVVRRPRAILEAVADRLGAPLQPVEFSRVYAPKLMTERSSRCAARAVAARPEVVELLGDIRRVAGRFG